MSLRSPSSLPELAYLDISPEYLDETHFRNPPKVEVGPDGVPRYRGEADDIEPVFEPYSTVAQPAAKRQRKRPNLNTHNDTAPPESPTSEDRDRQRGCSSSQTPTPSGISWSISSSCNYYMGIIPYSARASISASTDRSHPFEIRLYQYDDACWKLAGR
ncbi:camp-independent regulatory protein [Lentinula edodes]|uniref:Camp-independent regulatory protein n=1 Tax=Lentinula edodes TaxID=5353 RepID=A0A1Q3ECG9_LENED|nr:camp-independent regulatory protein [Lentinula edodes]